MDGLFDTNKDLDLDTFRNIVSLRVSQALFDDVCDGDDQIERAVVAAEMRVKQRIQPVDPAVIHRGFHYNQGIMYPFEKEPYIQTRYGDGSYGVWYGSLELDTTIHETAYHMVRSEIVVEGNSESGVIRRERAVYLVHCEALLVDISGKKKHRKELTADNYEFTQALGKRLHREGHPGLLYPSARCEGINLAVFNPDVLSDPRLHCYLTYSFDPVEKSLTVEREVGKALQTLTFPNIALFNSKKGIVASK